VEEKVKGKNEENNAPVRRRSECQILQIRMSQRRYLTPRAQMPLQPPPLRPLNLVHLPILHLKRRQSRTDTLRIVVIGGGRGGRGEGVAVVGSGRGGDGETLGGGEGFGFFNRFFVRVELDGLRHAVVELDGIDNLKAKEGYVSLEGEKTKNGENRTCSFVARSVPMYSPSTSFSELVTSWMYL
jgi:hypothetical protein